MNIYGVLTEPLGNYREDGCPAEPIVELVRAASHLDARLMAFAGTGFGAWDGWGVSVRLLVKNVDGDRAKVTDAPEWQHLFEHPRFPEPHGER